MLICPSNLEQFSKGVSKNLTYPRPGCFEGSYETTESMRNELQTTPK
jgi:hypothetical protein